MRSNGFLSPINVCRVLLLGLLLTNVGCYAGNGWAMNRSGMRQYSRGHYVQARKRFARAVRHDPCNPDYRHNLAMAIQKQGDVAGCERILQHNLTINAMHQPTYHSLAQLMVSQGRTTEAQELLVGWVATQPYVPESNIELAWIQRESGDMAGAEQSLRNALKASPTNPIALSHLGQLYQGTGRSDAAIAYYERSLAANWNQPEVQSRLATLLDPKLSSRSAIMQDSGVPMMASSPMMTDGMMVADGQIMTMDPTMAASSMEFSAPMMASNMSMGDDPAMIPEVSMEPNRRARRMRGRDVEPTIASYPPTQFGGPMNSWMPSGGQPTMAYQSFDTTTLAQNGQIPLSPPQMGDLVNSPYVSNNPGQTLTPQADPAHFEASATEMTASAPVVDPH
ncbi:tetratricopeptide repeat protein [Schlesneria paludicola]|uniref:tetratricopeptide repeat protein n=1 Tax=Schlesneria paludicola TaxID=360056 RepID=UPI00138AEE1D|nr:tetratricopeptide repeat protein [Schlesneria paludicola]